MRAEAPPDFETLSAYVDGELDARAAAEIAGRIAWDSEIARQVADIHALKARVAGLGADMVLVRSPIVRAPRRRSWQRLAAAAAIVALLAAGTIGGSLLFGRPAPTETSLLAAIVMEHDSWQSAGGPSDPVVPTSGSGGRLLAAAGLVQVYSRPDLELGGVAVSHSGYAGPRGCRLSVFRIEGMPIDATALAGLVGTDLAPPLVHAWSAAGSGFVAIARDMDAARFAALSTALERVSQRGEDIETASLAIPRAPCIS